MDLKTHIRINIVIFFTEDIPYFIRTDIPRFLSCGYKKVRTVVVGIFKIIEINL